MKKIISILLVLSLLYAPCSFALWSDLDQAQIDEAIEYGKDLSNKLGTNSDWSVRSSLGAGWVELTTPFSAVAKLARDYSIKSKRLSARDIERAIAPYKGKLIFNYFHYDIEKRFTKEVDSEYFAMIRTANRKVIYPIRYDTGTESVKKIDLEFTFSSADINPNSVICLLIREPSGYEHEFEFDLSKIR